MAFEKKAEKPSSPGEFKVPPLCGIDGCTENTAVFVRLANVSRCARHYQADIDVMGRSSNSRAAQVMAEAQMGAEFAQGT